MNTGKPINTYLNLNTIHRNTNKSELFNIPTHTTTYFFSIVKMYNQIIKSSYQIKYHGIIINNSFTLTLRKIKFLILEYS